jgi:hypothetical protein
MTEAVKDIAQAMRVNKPTIMQPELYNVVTSVVEFSQEALMAVLSHIVDHKAQSTKFIGMGGNHMSLWLRTYLSKHYYNLYRCPGALRGWGCMLSCL